MLRRFWERVKLFFARVSHSQIAAYSLFVSGVAVGCAILVAPLWAMLVFTTWPAWVAILLYWVVVLPLLGNVSYRARLALQARLV